MSKGRYPIAQELSKLFGMQIEANLQDIVDDAVEAGILVDMTDDELQYVDIKRVSDMIGDYLKAEILIAIKHGIDAELDSRWEDEG